jgi:Uncharacterised nucleotidyltransferase
MKSLSSHSPRLLALLEAASQGRQDLCLASFAVAQVQWAIETGIAPLLCHTTRADPYAALAPSWPLLRSADLTARMLSADQIDAMREIIEACKGYIPPLTLLKGISIGEQYYPAPHLRVMADLDVLVEEAARPAMEARLYRLGYRQQSPHPPAFYATHHHSMPFFHPHRGIWVEVHRALVSPHSLVGGDPIFGRTHLSSQLRLSRFQGEWVRRLSPELQIVYITTHWAQSFTVIGGMVALLDLIYLLQQTREAVRWEHLLDWVTGSATATYLYLLLTYLATSQLIDIAPAILRGLGGRQRAFGPHSLQLVHRLIDQYLVDGRPFGRVCSARNVKVLWQSLLWPAPPWCNLMRALWHLIWPG